MNCMRITECAVSPDRCRQSQWHQRREVRIRGTERSGYAPSETYSDFYRNQRFRISSTLYFLLAFDFVIDIEPAFLEILDQLRLRDSHHEIAPREVAHFLITQKNRRVADVVDHLQRGDEGIVFEGAAVNAEFDGMEVCQVHTSVASCAALLGVFEDVFRLLSL